jgi:lipopolysaccharide transport system ATP-binding protein
MSSIIEVRGLSKSFMINHEERERYVALRDVLSHKARNILPFGKKRAAHIVKEEFWALRDLDFDVQPGDRIGIIGRNGAGKSTLLKILSRITEPTRGKVTIRGRIASLLEVGTGFHPELTGRENIYLNGAILGMSRAMIRKQFDAIVDFAEVEKFLDTPVKRYSSGMYVRLAFAVAAHLEPEILVVDEVLAVGDAEFQKKCLWKMEDISEQNGRTVLFVSHQMDAIERLTGKCIYLQNGSIARYGDTRSVIDSYLSKDAVEEDVERHKDRQGNQQARVVKLQVLRNGQPVIGVRQGEQFQIRLGIKVSNPEKMDMSLVVENARQQPVFCTQLSDLQSPDIVENYAEYTIEVDKPVFRNGDYLVSIALFRPDKSEFFDILLHFPLVTVEGVVDTLPIPVDNRWGNLYFPLTWKREG